MRKKRIESYRNLSRPEVKLGNFQSKVKNIPIVSRYSALYFLYVAQKNFILGISHSGIELIGNVEMIVRFLDHARMLFKVKESEEDKKFVLLFSNFCIEYICDLAENIPKYRKSSCGTICYNTSLKDHDYKRVNLPIHSKNTCFCNRCEGFRILSLRKKHFEMLRYMNIQTVNLVISGNSHISIGGLILQILKNLTRRCGFTTGYYF